MTLIEFLIKFHQTRGWQQLYRNGGQPWTNLVNRELADPADAELILTEDQAGIEAKVDAQKTAAHIVWLNSTVWM
ncbi:MAG TPA: hypothetical protein VFR32_04455 [Gaiellaceae bacterium]|nr:hypothetical protein [Gaiellaceae bacterium]